MAEIRIKDVRKVYGGAVQALSDFSLDVEDGEFVVFVGPSGCGKSTALKIIAGLEAATAGHVWIGDQDVTEFAPGRRDIAMVFQNYALYPHLSVRSNIGFGLRMRHMPKAEIDRRVREVARILDVEALLDRRPRALSGGQRQRVALGRAIVREPQAFLMDEPLSNLDAKLRVHMRAEISSLHQRMGVTTIYVTHDQTEAMTMANRIVLMRDGVIQQVADPDTMFARPANAFVAGFIGSPSMNFFQSTLRQTAGEPMIDFGDAALPVKVDPNVVTKYADQRVLVGLRPEHMSLGNGAHSAVVQPGLVESLGSERYIYFPVPDGNAVSHARFSVQDEDRRANTMIARLMNVGRIEEGTPLPLSFDADYLHLFDPATEQAIN